MYSRVLLPLDGSALAEQVLPHATSLAEKHGSELILLRVIEPFVQISGLSHTDLERIKTQTAAWASEYLDPIAAQIGEQGISVAVNIVEGRAHEEIARFSEANEVDLIVMSTRGRSGLNRWLIGSVADRVVRGANVPVLLVRSRGE